MRKLLKIYSWNANGVRAVVKSGYLLDFLKTEKPDIVCLQEIKINDEARAKEQFDFSEYGEYWHPAEKAGYSGTAILTKIEPLSVSRGFGKGATIEEKEGRVLTLEFEKFYLINTYFPNAQAELTRLDFKEKFNDEWLAYAKKLEKKKPVVTCGDFNVAYEEIDLARPKENVGNAGFTKEERGSFDKFIKHGLIDTFRFLNKDRVQYSWWSYRMQARVRNVGWRIDYFLISESIKKNLKDAFILDTQLGSDHAPVGIVLDI